VTNKRDDSTAPLTPSPPRPLTPSPPVVALIGNPNTGKSTLFSALVGLRQRVGNYPGVTVEKKIGWMDHGGRRYAVIDLPGLYSLAARSRDEMVAASVLLGRYGDLPPANAVVAIVDSSNLQRNLYLVSQVLELGLPTVVALNMTDVARAQGISLDVRRLERELGVPVVPMQAHRRIGVDELKVALSRAVAAGPAPRQSPLPEAVHREVRQLAATAAQPSAPARRDSAGPPCGRRWRHRHRHQGGRRAASARAQPSERMPAWLIQRLLLDAGGFLEQELLPDTDTALGEGLRSARERLAQAGFPVPGVEIEARAAWASRVWAHTVTLPLRPKATPSDRVDRLLTHRSLGTAVFALVMFGMFQAVFVGAEPLTRAIESGIHLLGRLLESHLAVGTLRSLLLGGVLAGVGSVLAFLPQIAILFLFLAVLEDCGYMARAAFLMDRLMARVGLSGRSFIPLLSCFACTVPGVMACRVIDNERDRLTTILVAPFVPCSARLPVFTLLIAAFIPARTYAGGLVGLQGLVLVGLYVLGIVTAVLAALLVKGAILRGRTPPFLMDLPTYKWPSLRTAMYRVIERATSFLRFAGTAIVVVSILVWAALYWPRGAETVEGGHQRQSYLERFGRIVEPVFRPLGWDWRIGAAVMASLPAREIVVATLGVVFNAGQEGAQPQAARGGPEEGTSGPQAAFRAATWEGTDRPLFNVPVALSMMVFYALCAQCVGTLAAIRRETGTWRWPLAVFGSMTALAYCAALVTYQVGMWLGG
jgi:ferrous iron transport protein B